VRQPSARKPSTNRERAGILDCDSDSVSIAEPAIARFAIFAALAKEGGRMHGPADGARADAGEDLRGERNVCSAILRLAIRHLREAQGSDFRSAQDFFESPRLEFHCSVLDLDPESVRESARAIVVARQTPPRSERSA
jgi:hypothetical protein